MKNLPLYIIAVILFVVGSGLFFYKYRILNFPLTPDETASYWDIEVHLSFEAHNEPVKARLYLPGETDYFVIHSEQFLSGKFGLVTESKKLNRRAIWSARKFKGRQHLYYRALIQKTGLPASSRIRPGTPETPSLSEPRMAALKQVWGEIYQASADLDTLVVSMFRRLSAPEDDENITLLMGGKKASHVRQIEIAVLLLQYAGIPARMVSGFDLKEDAFQVKAVKWLEVYHHKKWHSYSPGSPENPLPESYLAWWRGKLPMYSVKGGHNYQLQITAQKNETFAVETSRVQSKITSPWLHRLSLLNLPVQNQAVYRITLLIPLGALLVVFLRNIIGFKTFGTFMPVLIALSFRETQLLWGVFLFTAVTALGLGARFYLERLKLLVVPRLSAVLIIVILIIAGLNIVMANLKLSLGLSVSLFPVVILSMVIERLSILWDERGAWEALTQGAGSLLASILIYFLIRNQTIEHLLFYFPELLLILLAATLLLGRYSGFRLIELYRFRDLIRKG